MFNKYILAFLCFSLTIIACSNKNDKSLKVKQLVEEYAANNLFNGTIVIANKDSVLFKESFGYADIKKNKPITSSTLFPIASVSKQFTATAIMFLHEKNLLSINDYISEYIKVPSYMDSVKIKNLMNHTSGIPDYWQNNIENRNDLIDQFLFNQDSLLFAPNTNERYSNSGYYLLGKIIEDVSGLSYSSFMQDKIFIPLNMNKTFIYQDNELPIARGYDLDWKINEYFISTANGGIISCIDDLQKWNNSLSENTIIKNETKKLMFQPAILNDGTVTKNGYGWNIGVVEASLFNHLKGSYKNVVSHAGNISSYGAYNQFDTNNGLYVILLSNQIRPELIDLVTKINKTIY